MSLELALNRKTKRLILLVIGLQTYLFCSLLVTASETAAIVLGKFYLFRPSSLALLIWIIAIFVTLRQVHTNRFVVWIAACVVVPIAYWNVIKNTIDEYRVISVDTAEMVALIDAATEATTDTEIVLIQPGHDGAHPEAALSRLIPRATLVNWSFLPASSASIAEWYQRVQFRRGLFANGCKEPVDYPVGALIIRNDEMPSERVIESCGTVVWSGQKYSLIDVL
jgi:hypothetical protein